MAISRALRSVSGVASPMKLGFRTFRSTSLPQKSVEWMAPHNVRRASYSNVNVDAVVHKKRPSSEGVSVWSAVGVQV